MITRTLRRPQRAGSIPVCHCRQEPHLICRVMVFTPMFAHQMPTYTYEPDGRRTAQMPDFAPVTRGSRKFTLEELATHKTVEDGWICVNNKVYDITNFVKHHPGNDLGGKVSRTAFLSTTTPCYRNFMPPLFVDQNAQS